MKGDFTRFTFDSAKHYDAVLMQQGRVQTDADWNEQVMIAAHRNRTETLDIIGPSGAPQDLAFGGKGAFEVYYDTGTETLLVNHGRYYVDGLMVESEAVLPFALQPGASQPPADGEGIYLFYLDVWRRHVTSLEDADIREVALAGADSGTRSQLVWQVRAFKVGEVGDDINAIPAEDFGSDWNPYNPDGPESTGKMDAEAGATPLENQLYRVEIHRAGMNGQASCKWSRDNATVVAGILTHTPPIVVSTSSGDVWRFSIDVDRNGRDSFSSFLPGGMVELSNEEFVLLRKPGVFGSIAAVAGDTITLEVPYDSAPLDSTAATLNPLMGTTPTLRRWDNPWNPDLSDVTILDVGPDYTTLTGRLRLERDITVKFDGGDERYQTGDYWLIPARTVSSSLVDWVPTVAQLPAGEKHTYAPIAMVKIQANGTVTSPVGDIRDMRQVFPTLRSLGGSSGGAIVTSGGATGNYVPKWSTVNSSQLINSTIVDNGTLVSIAAQLKVGGAGTSVPISMFTSAAISGMSGADLAATVPTSGVVKSYVEGVVNGTTGRIAKFTGSNAIGNSLFSESGTTVTLLGNLSVNSGNAATSTLNAVGAATLQSTLKVGTAGAAVTISRFTSEAIATMTSTTLGSTVPTAQGVKDFMVYSLPPGTVIAYGSETVPPGWLECNGTSLDGSPGTTYAALFGAIGKAFGDGNGSTYGFNTPDLRGQFIRGWDHNFGVDPDAASRFSWWGGGNTGNHVGTTQWYSNSSHSHSFSDTATSGGISANHSHNYWYVGYTYWYNLDLDGGGSNQAIETISYDYTPTGLQSASHTHSVSVSGTTGSSGGSETRPVNTYLMYIIKY